MMIDEFVCRFFMMWCLRWRKSCLVQWIMMKAEARSRTARTRSTKWDLRERFSWSSCWKFITVSLFPPVKCNLTCPWLPVPCPYPNGLLWGRVQILSERRSDHGMCWRAKSYSPVHHHSRWFKPFFPALPSPLQLGARIKVNPQLRSRGWGFEIRRSKFSWFPSVSCLWLVLQ